jgi:hypothetical protein
MTVILLIISPLNACNRFCPKISLVTNLFGALEAECTQLTMTQIPELCFSSSFKSKVIFGILLPGCSENFQKYFYSSSELGHINNTRSFIVVIVYMHTVFFEQVHPLHYISISSSLLFPFFKQCLVGFCILSMHIYVAYFNPLNPSASLSSPPPPPVDFCRPFHYHIHDP